MQTMPKGAKPGEVRRKPGTLNKDTITREKRLEECVQKAIEILGPEIMALSPKDVMLLAMRTALQAGWIFKAADIAKDVSEFVHPKLQSVTTNAGNTDETRSDEDLRAELDEIRARKDVADRARTVAKGLPTETEELGHPVFGSGGLSASEAPRPSVQ